MSTVDMALRTLRVPQVEDSRPGRVSGLGSQQEAQWLGPRVCNVQSPVEQIQLGCREIWRAEGDNRWRIVLCLEGVVWVTQAGDPQDYLLRPGDMWIVTQPGRLVVQAMQESCIQLTSSIEKASFTGKLSFFQ